jgi:DNA mismatch repair protein MutS
MGKIMKLTPAMEQYVKVKEEHPDCVVMFRMGDFYEMFYEDAKISARVLGITLTSRGKGETRAPLAGIPYHCLDQYVKKFVKNGYKIALVEQLEDPKKAKGLVKRGVVRIITPGTIVEDSILSDTTNNYICSVFSHNNIFAVALCDISTGEFITTECDSELKFISEIEKYRPSEIILPVSFEKSILQDKLNRLDYNISYHDDRFFWTEKSKAIIQEFFKVKNLEGFGIATKKLIISVSGALISYLEQTQKKYLGNIQNIQTYSVENYMILDSATQKNLEILRNIRDSTSRGTVFEVINKTSTSMGTRRLKKWILKPLKDIQKINSRLNAVEELTQDSILIEELREILKQMSDLERIISRITYGSANPRDLISLRNTLELIPKLKQLINNCNSDMFEEIKQIDTLEKIKDLIQRAIKDDPAVTIREGRMIRKGFNEKLDEIREISQNGKQWMLNFENEEREKTKIKNLKVKYNRVFGYFIEVTKTNIHLVPGTYIRKQTQANSERYITDELKEKEALILGAQDKVNNLEYELFMEIINAIVVETSKIQLIAKQISTIDCIVSYARVSAENNYIKPEISLEVGINIINGRHPVVEKIETGMFVENDTKLGEELGIFHIITGPNMAGKSTYLRQVALIILLAQIGCFVPADKAKIGIVDRIFSRVGAYDDLSMGQSTFMIEMNETANILNNATDKSFIIMDEVGRGTSTYDGLSLAWAIVEYLVENQKGLTLFATHYHQLNKLEKTYPNIKNYNVLVDENQKNVVFLHKIVEGGTDKSYGIHVARIAGMPKEVILRAETIMDRIENQEQLVQTIEKKELKESMDSKKEEIIKKNKTNLKQKSLFDSF